MSAFLSAATALAADANLGSAATWTSVAGGAAVSVRVVMARPEDAFPLGDAAQGAGFASVAMLPAAAISPAVAARGDTLVVAGVSYTVAQAFTDEAAASFTLGLRKT